MIFEKLLDQKNHINIFQMKILILEKEYIASEIRKAELIDKNTELKKIIFECEDRNCLE